MINQLLNVSTCILCGAAHLVRPPLCQFCLTALNSLRKKRIERRDLRSQSLLFWQNSSPRAFFELLHAMKHSQPSDWQIFAEWMCESFRLPKSAVLIPAPPRVWGTKDHAWCFAKALSDLTGFPMQNVLARIGGTQQKWLKKSERMLFRAELIEPDWQCSDYTTVILVDDIITTGSTARGCLTALGNPNRHQVWTLIDRGASSCGKSPLLI